MRWREEGMTFPEILVAALVVGIALAPLLHLYPQTLEINLESEVDVVLSAAAVRKTEEILALLRPPGAIDAVTSGEAACADLPGCRLTWTIATALSSTTTGVGKLKALTVAACQDTNGNAACDAGEPQVRYDAKLTSRP